MVTPLAGVWIEIDISKTDSVISVSLPLRECGLKYCLQYCPEEPLLVTPLAGVWIEIAFIKYYFYVTLSLPLRECGLKSDSQHIPYLT